MDKKKMTTVNFADINNHSLFESSPGILKVIKEDVDFYFQLNIKKNSDKVVVFSNGAYNRQKSKPPVFMRSSWVDDYESSCIYVDDRTLHDVNLTVGWGIGTPERYYLLDMSEVLIKIIQNLNIEDKNVVYFGSSAGGFMSLMFATLHRESSAIVNNPRIYAHRSKSRDTVFKRLFPGLTSEEILKKYGGRFSVTYMMKKKKYVPNVLYILNRDSESDYKNQYLPFIKMTEMYGIDISRISFWTYSNKEGGHDFIPRDKTAAIISMYQKGLLV